MFFIFLVVRFMLRSSDFLFFMNSFLILSFISWCLVVSPSIIFGYFIPVSLMPLMMLPSESCILQALLLYFSLCWLGALFLMSPDTVLTLWIGVYLLFTSPIIVTYSYYTHGKAFYWSILIRAASVISFYFYYYYFFFFSFGCYHDNSWKP